MAPGRPLSAAILAACAMRSSRNALMRFNRAATVSLKRGVALAFSASSTCSRMRPLYSGRILEQVLEALKAKATPRFKETVAARLKRIKALRDERIAHAAKIAADKGRPGAINPHYLTAELGKLLDDQDLIFNEGVTNAAAVLMQIPRAVPNTTVRAGGGGLG